MGDKGKISILVMREDARVKRLKIRPGFIKFVVFLLLLLVVLAAVSIYGVYRYRLEFVVLRDENTSMRQEIEDSKEKLIKLANIETLLEQGDQTEIKTLIGSYNSDSGEWLVCEEKTEAQAPPAQAPVKPAAPEKECPKIDLADIMSAVDAGRAGVDNFKAAIKGKRLNINFDLSNITPDTALEGDAVLELLDNGGEFHPLKGDRKDLNFQIQRFKQVTAAIPLPAKFDPGIIYGVKLFIKDADGKTLFSRIYPLRK